MNEKNASKPTVGGEQVPARSDAHRAKREDPRTRRRVACLAASREGRLGRLLPGRQGRKRVLARQVPSTLLGVPRLQGNQILDHHRDRPLCHDRPFAQRLLIGRVAFLPKDSATAVPTNRGQGCLLTRITPGLKLPANAEV